jgi:hypothetical protein
VQRTALAHGALVPHRSLLVQRIRIADRTWTYSLNKKCNE